METSNCFDIKSLHDSIDEANLKIYYKFSNPLSLKEFNANSKTYSSSPIVIDNGSFRTRAGFGCEFIPRLSFAPISENVTIRGKNPVFIGNDIQNKLPLSPYNLKTPFTKNVVCDFGQMEKIFDYIFDNLLPEANEIKNPILLTESYCNPTYSRLSMIELLFEYYNVPSINFGIDFLFSHFYNNSKINNFKIKNSHFISDYKAEIQRQNFLLAAGQEFSFVARLKFNSIFENIVDAAQRIPIGGKTPSIYLYETLKRRIPSAVPYLTENNINQILTKYCYFSNDFNSELDQFFEKFNKNNENNENNDENSNLFGENGDKLNFLGEKTFFNKVILNCGENKLGIFDQFRADCKSISGDWTVDKAVFKVNDIKTLEFYSKMIQILNLLLLRRREGLLDAHQIDKLLLKFGIVNVENASIIIEVLNRKISKIKEKYTKLSIENSSNSGRVKTREHSRKQKDLQYKKIRVLSQIEEKIKLPKSKFWENFQLLNHSLTTAEDIFKAVEELEILSDRNSSFDLGIERFKALEVFYQPSLVGFTQNGGIADAFSNLISHSIDNYDILITGGASQFKNFNSRLSRELKMILSPDKKFNLIKAEDAVYDAWKGARLFSQSDLFYDTSISQSDYKEKGIELEMKKHLFSNKYIDLPVDVLSEFD